MRRRLLPLLTLVFTLFAAPVASAEPLGTRTFDQAYDQAPNGVTTVIDVPDGSYGDPALTGTKLAGTKVVFRGQNRPTLSYITLVGNNHVEFDGFDSGGWHIKASSFDVTMRNINANGKVFITDSSFISSIGGYSDGGGYVRNGSQIKTFVDDAVIPHDILIDGMAFRNYRQDPATADHVDCLHILAGENITIRNSNFDNCEHFAVLFTRYLAPTPSHVVVENNHFGAIGEGFYSLSLGGGHAEAFDDVLVQNNDGDENVTKSMTTGTTNTLSNVRFLNNGLPVAGCGRTGVTCTNNGWDVVPGGGEPTPEPTPTPTPTPTPEPTPTPTPEPTPYEPACAPTCDEQIAQLADDRDAAQAALTRVKALWADLRAALE